MVQSPWVFGCTRWNASLGWYEGHHICYTHHTDLSGVFLQWSTQLLKKKIPFSGVGLTLVGSNGGSFAYMGLTGGA